MDARCDFYPFPNPGLGATLQAADAVAAGHPAGGLYTQRLLQGLLAPLESRKTHTWTPHPTHIPMEPVREPRRVSFSCPWTSTKPTNK